MYTCTYMCREGRRDSKQGERGECWQDRSRQVAAKGVGKREAAEIAIHVATKMIDGYGSLNRISHIGATIYVRESYMCAVGRDVR